jgi:hypothetical protein
MQHKIGDYALVKIQSYAGLTSHHVEVIKIGKKRAYVRWLEKAFRHTKNSTSWVPLGAIAPLAKQGQ